MIKSSKNITLSNPLFHKEILNKIRKWKKLALSHPFLVYNRGSSSSGIFKNKIQFFLTLQLHKQNLKFFNILWDHLNSSLVPVAISHYQSKTEKIVKNLQNIFSSSVVENRTININKEHNANNLGLRFQKTFTNLNHYICPLINEFLIKLWIHFRINTLVLKNRIVDSDTTTYLSIFPLKNTFLINIPPKDSLRNTFHENIVVNSPYKDEVSKNRDPNFILRPLFPHLENTTTDKVGRTIEKVKNSNLLFTPKLSESLSDRSRSTFFENGRFLKKSDFQKSSVFFSRMVSLGKTITFKIGINDLNFLNRAHQPHITLFSKTRNSLHTQNFVKKSLKTDFPAVCKKILLSSFPDIDSRPTGETSVFEKRKVLLFTADNKISDLEYRKDRNFHVNTESFIFRTQSNMEQKIEEKIEQKIRQKIEQVKKVASEEKENISEQARESKKSQSDINHISDQVFRLMEQKLKIERERRGTL